MKMFKFTLDPVLRQKELAEDIKKKEFSYINQKLLHCQKILEEAFSKRVDCQSKLSELTAATLDIEEIKAYHRYMQHINNEITKLQLMLEKIRLEFEKKQNELLAAMKDKKKMDKLKEIEFNEFKERLKVLEQKIIDETAVIRFSHGSQS